MCIDINFILFYLYADYSAYSMVMSKGPKHIEINFQILAIFEQVIDQLKLLECGV